MKIIQLIDPSITPEQLSEALTVGRALKSRGHDVRLFHRLDEDVLAPFKEAGFTTTRCRLGGAFDFISPVVVSRVIDSDDRVVLQVFTPGVLTCAARVRRLAPEGARVRIAYHAGRTMPQFTTPAKERLATDPDLYVVPFSEASHRIAGAYPAIPSGRIAVVAPMLERQSPLPSPTSREDENSATTSESAPLTLLFYGHIIPSKGLDRLLNALEGFTPSDLRLIVIGTGEGRHVMPMLRRVRANGVNDLIEWAGDARRPSDLVSRADIAVFPAIGECDDYRPMLTAMSHGLPVIASALSSALHIFKDSDRYLEVDPDNAVQFNEDIRRVISDPVLRQRLSESSLSCYSDFISGTDITARLESLYFSLLTSA